MFFVRQEDPFSLAEVNNVVWYGKRRDKKRVVTQWADRGFYEQWEDAMREAFYLLGMMDRFEAMTSDEVGIGTNCPEGADGLGPVPGHQNRTLLRRAMTHIDGATTSFERILLTNGMAVRYKGDKKTAMQQWGGITELIVQTTIMAIVTPGLQYYVEGTQVGYELETRHLFKRSNNVERTSAPNKPHWRAHVSGYVIDIYGDWEQIRKARKFTGYNMFQMLQLRINEELEMAIRKER